MTALSRDELASKAGVPAAFVDQLVELRIIRPDADGAFDAGAVRATRMVQALERGGLPLAGIGEAVRSGHVSFEFLGLPGYERFAGLSDTTFQQLHETTDIQLELLLTMREAIGLARPSPGDQVRDDELQLASALRMTAGFGLEPATVERFMRVYADNLRRIVESESDWFRTYIMQPFIAGGMTEAGALTAAAYAGTDAADNLQVALLAIYRALQEQAWMRTIFEVVENELERAGLHTRLARPPAVSFLDLTGYTRLTEERGDVAAAELAADLARSVRRISRAHGGMPVKWLGDGVMFHFDEPGGGVVAALEMVERIPAAGLPPARVGIDAGPVFFQDGDYFGRTVNVAARIAAYARAGEVLVSDAVRGSLDPATCQFEEVGPTELKGVGRPVVLHLAKRA